jgi:hypothetical protein
MNLEKNAPPQQQHHNHHDEDAISINIWSISVVIAAIALFYMGNWKMGACFVVFAILYNVYFDDLISEPDQYEIRYNIYSPDDVLKDMVLHANNNNTSTAVRTKLRTAVLAALLALTKKYGKQQQEKEVAVEDISHLSLVCQEAVYVALHSFEDHHDVEVLSASFALLALVAKNDAVHERHLQQADIFGLDKLVQAMDRARKAAETCQEKKAEQQHAELQRKACLMIGALADGNAAMASQIVNEGGLLAILDTISWYRFQKDVVNWGLWAIFILGYEYPKAKSALVELHGIPIILEAMKNCRQCVEVARHGIAILFDLLRDQQQPLNDAKSSGVWKVRDEALNAGLHEVLLHALEYFSTTENKDIVMMARGLLIGTQYHGPLPDFIFQQ